jgi:hypothetical protein
MNGCPSSGYGISLFVFGDDQFMIEEKLNDKRFYREPHGLAFDVLKTRSSITHPQLAEKILKFRLRPSCAMPGR